MSGRHAQHRVPRAHWLILCLVLLAVASALLFEGWTVHEVDAAKKRLDCTEPVPAAVSRGGPVLRIGPGTVESATMPPHTVALTFDGGPDPVWTPRLLELLATHHAHATFFLFGSSAVRHPDLVRRIRAEGHEIGSLTYTGAVMGAASPLRARLELSLTQTALEGSAGIRTRLLRLPRTGPVDTLCGAEWTAAHHAAADGYLLVAADTEDRLPPQGVVRQFGHSADGYQQAKALLGDRNGDEFTTVTGGLKIPPANTPASLLGRWQGTALIWMAALGHACAASLTWTLWLAVGLGVLRLVLLVVFARVHVRRLQHRCRAAASWPREVNDPVTVLIPACNEEAGIESTIRSLLDSTHPHLQIIVIDDGSTDRTAEIAAGIGDPRLAVVRQANAGKASALNTGLAHARHGIVVMVDADTVFEPETVHQLIQPLAHPAVGAVSGNTKVGNRRGLLGRWQHLEYVSGFNLDRRTFDVLECMPTVPGAIGAFRLDALLSVGGVSQDTLAEDTDLTMALWRAGWRVVYEESAIAWTEVPLAFGQLWRQRYRWCYGTLQAMRKHRRAVWEVGPAGRFGRRGLAYLAVFQVGLPLLAPVIDVFALYGVLFLSPVQSAGVWLGFLAVQLACAGYALRLDGERLNALWVMPFQIFAYRQLMYLVIIQSMVTAVLGSRLTWHRMQRTGTATQQRGQPAPARSLAS
ncbi:bifunctional polysaccharide deacetylase/glycosyltransferase family 2 protein [Streptomyces sp. NPDC020801]|uniref:bifunctional polysaccharide deacetylase/glycosyltransferase family 2 protein n=1 Tax=unclassified Streptomyces TaxID=2593676 RepID=UPI0037886EEE